jgi:predicted RNA-binding protein
VVLVNYWVIPLSEENWFVVKEISVYGAPEVARGRHIRDLVEPGDVLVFYVTKRGSKRLGGKFVARTGLSQSGSVRRSRCGPTRLVRAGSSTPLASQTKPLKLGVANYSELAPKTKLRSKQETAWGHH